MKLFPSELSNNSAPVIVFEAYEEPGSSADETIVFPFPKNMSLGDSASYGSMELAGFGQGVNDLLDGNLSQALSSFTEGFLSGASSIKALIPGLDKIGPATSQRFGRVQNKRETTVFNQMGIRSFSFEFSFIPESASDSETLRNIEIAFRKYMYPEEVKILGLSALRYPALWTIKARGSHEKYYSLPLKKGAFLESMNVTYGSGNSFAKFANTGAPTQVNFTLSFKEARALTREDVSK